MIPSENPQYAGIIQLLQHFGWTWIGLVVSDDDTGEILLRTLIPRMHQSNICTAFKEIIPAVKNLWDKTIETQRLLEEISSVLSSTKTEVILAHGVSRSMVGLQRILILQEREMKPIERVWIVTAQWDFSSAYDRGAFALKSFNGTLSFTLHTRDMGEYEEFLRTLNPNQSRLYLIHWFWSNVFRCSFPKYNLYQMEGGICTGEEDLGSLSEIVFEMRMSGQSYSIYNAVYAVAHALHAMFSSRAKKKAKGVGATWNLLNIYPWQVGFSCPSLL